MDKKKIIIIELVVFVCILIIGIAITLNLNNQTPEPINNTTQSTEVSVDSINKETQSDSSSSQENDPGAFYSRQSNEMIYTGDVKVGPDGHTRYKHLGYNEWEMLD